MTSNNTIIIIGIIFCCLLSLGAAIGGYFYYKKKRDDEAKKETTSSSTTSTTPPTQTAVSGIVNTPKYIGCYTDVKDGKRTMSTRGPSESNTIAQCNSLAVAAESPYFGMQFWPGSGSSIGTQAECWYGDKNLTLTQAESQGTSTACDKGTDGNMYGGAYANAVYSSSY